MTSDLIIRSNVEASGNDSETIQKSDNQDYIRQKGYLKYLRKKKSEENSDDHFISTENQDYFKMLTVICGKNGIGKSSLLKMIPFYLNRAQLHGYPTKHKKLKYEFDTDQDVTALLLHFDSNILDLRMRNYINFNYYTSDPINKEFNFSNEVLELELRLINLTSFDEFLDDDTFLDQDIRNNLKKHQFDLEIKWENCFKKIINPSTINQIDYRIDILDKIISRKNGNLFKSALNTDFRKKLSAYVQNINNMNKDIINHNNNILSKSLLKIEDISDIRKNFNSRLQKINEICDNITEVYINLDRSELNVEDILNIRKILTYHVKDIRKINEKLDKFEHKLSLEIRSKLFFDGLALSDLDYSKKLCVLNVLKNYDRKYYYENNKDKGFISLRNLSNEHIEEFIRQILHSQPDENKEQLFKEIKEKLDKENVSLSIKLYLDIMFTPNPKMNDSIKNKLIPLEGLSNGQQIIFLSILWDYLMDIDELSKILKNKKIVLLLDEPDSHIHLSAIKYLYETIKNLIIKYRIQVIMTTHNPVTIALIPNESLFILSYDDNKNELKIEQKLKKECISSVNDDLLLVNEPFKEIYVEGKGDDKEFYILCKNKLNLQDNENQIYYHSMGDREFSNYFVKTEQEIRINNIFGILDADDLSIDRCPNKEEFEDLFEEVRQIRKKWDSNLKVLERYTLENYVYDPIYLYFVIIKIKAENEKKKYNDEKFMCELNEFYNILTNDIAIQEIKEIEYYSELNKLLNESNPDLIIKVFNKIIENYSNYIRSGIQKKINQSRLNEVQFNKFKDWLYSDNSKNKIKVKLNDSLTLDYDAFILIHSGKKIKKQLSKSFKKIDIFKKVSNCIEYLKKIDIFVFDDIKNILLDIYSSRNF